MSAAFIDPRRELPVLRRASLLLERLCEDDGCAQTELWPLMTGIDTIHRAAVDGRLVHRTAVRNLEVALAHVDVDTPSPVPGSSVHEILRRNALADARELVQRLDAAERLTRRGPAA